MLSSFLSSPVDASRPFRASRFDNSKDNRVKIISVSWGDLRKALTEHDFRNEKDGPLFSPARYEPGLNTFRRPDGDKSIYWTAIANGNEIQRLDANVRGISYAVLDIEGKKEPLNAKDLEVLAECCQLAGLAFALATTHSHTPDDARARLVLVPDREIGTDELWATLRGLGEAFCVPIDSTCKNPSRMFYMPAARPGSPAFSASGEGCSFSVDAAKRIGEQLIVADEESKPKANPIAPARYIEREEAVKRARAYANATPPAVEGQNGDQKTYTLCVTVARGFDLSDSDSLEALREWNATCSPPWDEGELKKKISNARIYGKEPIGARLAESSLPSVPADFMDRDPRDLLREMGPDEPEQPVDKGAESKGIDQTYAKALCDLKAYRSKASSARAGLRFTDWSSLRTKTFPKTPWLIEGLLTEQAVAACAGEPKATKTWSALEMAVALATDTPAFGRYPAARRMGVACFMAEDHERSIHSRCRALMASRGLPEDAADGWLHVISRASINVESDEEVAGLIAAVRRIPRSIGLLVIDPLRDIHGADENDSGAMSRVMGQLRAIRDILGCTVLFVHHAGKYSESTASRRAGQMMRGSSAIHGALDAGLYLSKTKTDGKAHWENTALIEIKAARGAGTFTLSLDVEDDECDQAKLAKWTVDYGEEAQAKEAGVAGAILALLAQSDLPMPSGRIGEKVGKRKSDTLAALHTLREAGKAKEATHGKKKLGWVICNSAVALDRFPAVPGPLEPLHGETGSVNGFPIYREPFKREPLPGVFQEEKKENSQEPVKSRGHLSEAERQRLFGLCSESAHKDEKNGV